MSKRELYRSIVSRYRKDAHKHFQACGLIPDNEDLAGCIFEFWGQDSPSDLGDTEYAGILAALEG